MQDISLLAVKRHQEALKVKSDAKFSHDTQKWKINDDIITSKQW